MGPLEASFFTILIIFTLIGVARGYRHELGSTIIIFVSIFLVTFLSSYMVRGFTFISDSLLGQEAPDEVNFVLSIAFMVVFSIFIFAGYAGRTLDFPGRELPPPAGSIISALVGLINGYLVGGTLWYFLSTYSYPLGDLVPVTNSGRLIEGLLPQTLITSPVVWVVPVAVLLLLRVRG